VTAGKQLAGATLGRGHGEITSLLALLSPDDMLASGIGGAEWSPKDLLGHLALWQEIGVRSVDEFRRGEEPWIAGVLSAPGPGPNDAELAVRAPWPLGQAQEAYERSRNEVLARIEGLTEQEWSSPVRGWTEDPGTLGGLLGVVLGKEDLPFGHAFAHTSDMRAFVECAGDPRAVAVLYRCAGSRCSAD